MKLARIGAPDNEVPALIVPDDSARSLAGVIDDLSGRVLSDEGLDQIRELNVDNLPFISGPDCYGPCVGSTSQFICVGLNYADHVKEAGMEMPTEPVLFMKSPSAICGAFDDVMIPRNAEKVDWEVELAIVIGRQCSYVEKNQARDYIAGYCVVNDVSERAFQLEGTGQWVKGKSADTFGPTGPWLVTRDEIEDVDALDVWLSVNGEEMQRSNTREMIFSVDHLVSYISQYMTLQPGDIISTGTPFGVGMGLDPQRYLKAGDTIRLGIDGLGVQEQQVVPWAPK